MLARQLKESVAFLRERTELRPEIGLILGSGLGGLAEKIENATAFPYAEIPHFPLSTVEGHRGRLVIGFLGGRCVAAMQGRFHCYEGYDLKQVTYPVRVMRELGARILVVTNAAGGINTSFRPGDLMLIADHINLLGDNPLTGPNDEALGPRFPDMSAAYPVRLREAVKRIAVEKGLELREGIYVCVKGPSYETPAEIRYLRAIGADAVGMSTVPEVIVANHGGMAVLGLSCITNMAAGVLDRKLDHREVIATADKAAARFGVLVEAALGVLE